jgi:hypothetical protein
MIEHTFKAYSYTIDELTRNVRSYNEDVWGEIRKKHNESVIDPFQTIIEIGDECCILKLDNTKPELPQILQLIREHPYCVVPEVVDTLCAQGDFVIMVEGDLKTHYIDSSELSY